MRERLTRPFGWKLWHVYVVAGAVALVLCVVVVAGFAAALYLRGQSREETERNARINRAQETAIDNLRRIQELERPPTEEETAEAAGAALAACATRPRCRAAFRTTIRRARIRPQDVPALTPDDAAPGDTGSGGGTSGGGGGGGSGPQSTGPSSTSRQPAPSPPARRPVAPPAPAPQPPPSTPSSPPSTSGPGPTGPNPPATTVPRTPVTPPQTVPQPTPPNVPVPIPGLPSVCTPVAGVNCPPRVARELQRGRVGEALEEVRELAEDAAEEARRAVPRCDSAPATVPATACRDSTGPG
jgi:hypothetical protein